MRDGRNRRFALVAALTLIWTPMVLAAASTYKVDGSHSAVVFRVKHMNVAYFYGRFNEVSGRFVFDDTVPSNGTLKITINADSVDTDDPRRDDFLKGPDFFDAKKHPELTFKSTKIEPAGADKLKVTGNMTVRGITKSITVDLERTGEGKDPWGGYRAGFETVFQIKRSEYGMSQMLNGLSDEVRLIVSIEGVRQ